MINNWFVTRPKRKLLPIIDTLSVFSLQTLGDVWVDDLGRQLDFEQELERNGLKRPGRRRDRRAGGARTYESWLFSLGLTFREEHTDIVRLTMAGEDLINGHPPVPIMTNQLMKFQYPSPYSRRGRVNIADRFRIRPFRFILRLLLEDRLHYYITEEELARFVITEAEDESDACFDHVVNRILHYRSLGDRGDDILPPDFAQLHSSSTTGVRSLEATLKSLKDNANTFINYLEYTQFIGRMGTQVTISPESIGEVQDILNDGTRLRPYNGNQEETFQRNFGLSPGRHRDNRTFNQGTTVTADVIIERMVRNELLRLAGERPITHLTPSLVSEIATNLGFSENQVEGPLSRFNADTLSVYEASYVDMAFKGRDKAIDFERATVDLFESLGFDAWHVGSTPRNPDVYVESSRNFSGIIDNKAYVAYSISNDHRNRMVNNYLPLYQIDNSGLSFFMYIAGGFGRNINRQIQGIAADSGVNGCVITANDLIRLLQRHLNSPVSHDDFLDLFTSNRQITLRDIDAL